MAFTTMAQHPARQVPLTQWRCGRELHAAPRNTAFLSALSRCGILTTAELWKAATQPVLLGLMPEALLNSAHHFSGQAVELNRLMLAHHGER